MENIGIIGAGKVGVSLGKHFSQAGLFDVLSGFYSRTEASALEAAKFTNSLFYGSLQELVEKNRIIFITVPDSMIAGVWEECRKLDIAGKIFCHCSGALASSVFGGIKEAQAFGFSIHPFMAVSDKFNAYQQFTKVLFTIEGSEEKLDEMIAMLQDTGLMLQIISKKQKLLYHASASLASNCMVGLTQMAIESLMECGFSQENARRALKPLMMGNLSNVLEYGAEKALTGPVERADVQTVRKHLQVFQGKEEQVYRLLSKEILEVARRKNPQRDYREMEEVLFTESIVSKDFRG